MPEVSLIIPVYNAEKYLKECLDSVMGQSFPDIEVIVVDDGSEDSSPEILDTYKRIYNDRITIIRQENAGQSAARNKGIVSANGRYIMFADSDDYIAREYVETLYREAVREDFDMVICDFTRIRSDGRILKEIKANLTDNGVRFPSYISPNRIIRKSILDNYDIKYTDVKFAEDIPFVLQLEAYCKDISVINYYGYFYRQSPGSVSNRLKLKKLKAEDLPFKEMGRVVESIRNKDLMEDKTLSLYICRIFTSFLFDLGRKSSKETRDMMCDEMSSFMDAYFPDYYDNPLLRPGKWKRLPVAQKFGTWEFAKHLHKGNLKEFAAFVSHF